MGATDFIELGQAPTAEEAFRQAVNSAAHEYGHGGYTGSIAEKSDFKVIDHTVRCQRAAYAFASSLLGDFEDESPVIELVQSKWGPAAAIPVSFAPELERAIKVRVDVSPERQYYRKDLVKVLAAEGLVRENETIDHVGATFEDRTRVQARRTEGKVVTRYFYAGQGGWMNTGSVEKGDAGNWITGFATMAEWRKDAQERAKVHGGRYECIGITRRFDAEPLDVVEAVITKRTATIEATLVRPSEKDKLSIDGWLFFGYASC